MADIDLRRPHGLGIEAARTAAERLAADLGRKFDLKGTWAGDVLRFERPGVNGALALTAQDLHLTVSLGFVLKAMKGSIENAVMQELDRLFPGASTDGPATAKKPASAPKKSR